MGYTNNKETKKNSSHPVFMIIVFYTQHDSNVQFNFAISSYLWNYITLSVHVFSIIFLLYKIPGKIDYIRIIYHMYFFKKKKSQHYLCWAFPTTKNKNYVIQAFIFCVKTTTALITHSDRRKKIILSFANIPFIPIRNGH